MWGELPFRNVGFPLIDIAQVEIRHEVAREVAAGVVRQCSTGGGSEATPPLITSRDRVRRTPPNFFRKYAYPRRTCPGSE